MRSPNIVPLPLRFFFQQLVELCARFTGLRVVALLFAFAPILFEQAEEVEHLGVSSDIDHASRAYVPRHLVLPRHHHLLLLLIVHHHLPSISSVLHNFILDLLHELKEFTEGDATIRVRVKSVDEFAHFIGVTLKTAHDGLQVFDLDGASPLRVEHIEDAAKVLDLLVSKGILIGIRSHLHLISWLRHLLSSHVIVGVIKARHRLLTGLWVGPWEGRS